MLFCTKTDASKLNEQLILGFLKFMCSVKYMSYLSYYRRDRVISTTCHISLYMNIRVVISAYTIAFLNFRIIFLIISFYSIFLLLAMYVFATGVIEVVVRWRHYSLDRLVRKRELYAYVAKYILMCLLCSRKHAENCGLPSFISSEDWKLK